MRRKVNSFAYLIFYFYHSQDFYRHDIFHVCNLFLTSHAQVSHKQLAKNRLLCLMLFEGDLREKLQDKLVKTNLTNGEILREN
jgi:hypothetical protein